MSEEFPTLWKWLNENTGAVTAMAASIAAGATVIYTIVTAFLLGATRRQAKLTHQMIEASHTPYVSIRVEEPTDTSEQGMLAFNMVFENQGAVLAHIVKWEIGATLMGSKDKVHLKSPIQGLDSPSDTTLAPG